VQVDLDGVLVADGDVRHGVEALPLVGVVLTSTKLLPNDR
jgi:hypothetical protein